MKTHQPPNTPNRSTDTDVWFQNLRQKTLEELRQDIQHKNRVFSLQLNERLQRDQEARRFLQECGLDLQRLDQAEKQEEQLLDQFLQQTRPPLLKRPRKQEAPIRTQQAKKQLVSEMGQPLTLAGTDVVTNLRTGSEPTFTPQIARNIKNTMSGSGWGCGVKENPNYPDTMAYWWYTYTPSQSRVHNFWVSTPYAGFYVIRANDRWYNCKYSKTYAFYEVDVYQFSWRGADRRTVVDRRSGNINETGRLEGALYWSFTHPLEGGAPVTVRITATLDVYAQGSGDYGELNFADGTDNYLDEPVVSIY